MMLLKAAEGILNFLLPPSCLSCHAPLGPVSGNPSEPRSLLCSDCRGLLLSIPQANCCPRCGEYPLTRNPQSATGGDCLHCRDLPQSFDECRSAFPYDGPAGAMIRNLKYRKGIYLAPWIAALVLEASGDWLRKASEDATLVAVPMHWRREFRRGFNQADELVKVLGQELGRPLLPKGILVRTRPTPPQARTHKREERFDNLGGAFEVHHPDAVRGRKLLLVDDVMTTGATVSRAAGVLLKAGAQEVNVFTCSRPVGVER